jgi:hypothetical protein
MDWHLVATNFETHYVLCIVEDGAEHAILLKHIVVSSVGPQNQRAMQKLVVRVIGEA